MNDTALGTSCAIEFCSVANEIIIADMDGSGRLFALEFNAPAVHTGKDCREVRGST